MGELVRECGLIPDVISSDAVRARLTLKASGQICLATSPANVI
jgi:hypothetical protein